MSKKCMGTLLEGECGAMVCNQCYGNTLFFQKEQGAAPAVTPGPCLPPSSLEISQAEPFFLRVHPGRGRAIERLSSPPRSPPGGRGTPWSFLDWRASLRRALSRIQGGRKISLAGQGAQLLHGLRDTKQGAEEGPPCTQPLGSCSESQTHPVTGLLTTHPRNCCSEPPFHGDGLGGE